MSAMNLPTLLVLLLVALALFFAVRGYLRGARSGGCSCGSCSGCAGAPGCPHARNEKTGTSSDAPASCDR